MKNRFFHSILSPALMILVGGFLSVAIFWLLYVGIYLSIEALFYANDPQSVPADQMRTVCAVALCLLYLGIFRVRWNETLKATLFVAPMTTLLISVVLGLYTRPIIAVIVFFALVGASVFLFFRFKKPWIYYYALVISIVIALLYAWPTT